MPLPTADQPWPPQPFDELVPQLRAWSAWWAGDPDQLAAVYTGKDTPRVRPSQYAGGVVGKAARWFWGTPPADQQGRRHRLHVPVAADIATASADLLFSEPPQLTHPAAGTAGRLAELVDDGMHTALAEAAEVSAALAGVYLRVTWDKELVPEGPFITSVHSDAAVPEFRWGRLYAVTFWRVVHQDGNTVWRHLERHELDGKGVGIILHGLYEGTAEQLGASRRLTSLPATAHLDTIVDGDGMVSTESPGLAVEFVPNRGPARRWRSHPIGAHLGRSDLEGIEPEMDALDEVWSSWMRDIRLGKARVFVASGLVDGAGPGKGGTWDADREVYAQLDALASREGGLKANLHAEQFDIRVEQHRGTCEELLRIILRTAGYSAATFGEASTDSGAPITATETRAKQSRSYLTRDRKVRRWRPATARIARKLLAVDRAIFQNATVDDLDAPVEVQFPDGVQDDQKVLAETANLLRQAEAASTRTLVQMNHPDWDDTRVDEEVDAILAEKQASTSLLNDPMLTGREAPDPPPGDDDQDDDDQ